MSLTAEQNIQTSRELRANLEISGLTLDQIAEALDLAREQVEDALAMNDAVNPTHAWMLRDYLIEVIENEDKTPVPFTVLKVNRFFPYPQRRG